MLEIPDIKNSQEIIAYLRSLANPENIVGMERYGINPENPLGISMPVLRAIAKKSRRNHALALELWESGIHEARILAALVDDPRQVTPEQMESWVADFDSWDVCDQVCGNLFDRTPYAYAKAKEWSYRDEQFVKRAAFALMAYLALHDKKAPDDPFLVFLVIIPSRATDERNFVKKAVNWALRQIGKRNRSLNGKALQTASDLIEMDTPATRWIGTDAFRELTSEKVQSRLKG